MKPMQEEAEKYAMHYAKDFLRSIVKKEQSFQEHYEQLDFDRLFFEGILYTNPSVSAEWSEKRLDTLREDLSEKELNERVEEEETRFLQQLAREFKGYFAVFYIEEINLAIEECEEGIAWAKDDIRYHENREYIQDKAVIGDVSEEERAECIQEGEERLSFWVGQKQRLVQLKQEMEQIVSKS